MCIRDRVNTAGMIPIIFAQSILTFFPLIAGLFVTGSGSVIDNIATASVASARSRM